MLYRAKYGDEAYIQVPCGKCEACITRKANEWGTRVYYEWLHSKTACFVTLTYSDEFLHYGDVYFEHVDFKELAHWALLNKRDCQLFMKRLRKLIGNGVRFFLGAEYGEQTTRPHYHLILFNYPQEYKETIYDVIAKCWSLGTITVNESNINRVRYVAKYCYSQSQIDTKLVKNFVKPFILCSRRPAIGHQYICSTTIDYHNTQLEPIVPMEDFNMPMPRYYREKIFTNDSKEELYQRFINDDTPPPSEDEIKVFKKRFYEKKKNKVL